MENKKKLSFFSGKIEQLIEKKNSSKWKLKKNNKE
jgi:hypothetical protein